MRFLLLFYSNHVSIQHSLRTLTILGERNYVAFALRRGLSVRLSSVCPSVVRLSSVCRL